MALYRWKDGKFEQIDAQQIETRSPIVSDEMALTWHPVTGKMHNSKSEFRKDTIRAGCREMGNDVPTTPREMPDTPGRVEELSRVYDQLKYGRRD